MDKAKSKKNQIRIKEGQRDIDEAIVEVEFSNLSNDLKSFIIYNSKEITSKNLVYIRDNDGEEH